MPSALNKRARIKEAAKKKAKENAPPELDPVFPYAAIPMPARFLGVGFLPLTLRNGAMVTVV